MAELLLRIVDKIGSTPAKDILSSKAGDVVVVCPDGWEWSQMELSSPAWKIIKMPGVDPAALNDLVRIGNGRRRDRKIDLSGPAAVRLLAAPNPLVLTPAQITIVMALRVTKPALAPIVLG